MKQSYWNQLSESQQGDLLQRPVVASQQNIRQQTADIIDVVRREGDSAVKIGRAHV